ncbi:MAG: DNA-binding protein [Crenarchaeota archaeon]|nr:DNA-binding protein [Thermoproteota archaeon]
MDKEIEELLRKKALEAWQQVQRRLRTSSTQMSQVETKEEIINKLRKIVKGSRTDEIIRKALDLYGDDALKVFREIVRLYERGSIRELMDYELYQILERLGLHVPLETRIRIVKHGTESSISDILSK